MSRRRAWEPPLFEYSVQGPIAVMLDPDVSREHGDAANEHVLGVNYPADRAIIVDPEIDTQTLRVVVLHEVLHQFFFDSGLGRQVGDAEEVFVQSLASFLVAREDFLANPIPENPVPLPFEIPE